ncbi:MAG TPA: FliM/FliN family flagellar motor switch protein [Terriglobia bacterium]|nr:FliM/FliN family flagellar motor switch protein [Terriglobia bacterium]
MNPTSESELMPATAESSSQFASAGQDSGAQSGSAVQGYVDLWLRYIADALTRFAGATVSVEAQRGPQTPTTSGAPREAGFWIRLFGGKAGEQAFFLSGADGLRLSQLLSGKPAGETATLTATDQESVVQLFQQIATMIPTLDWLGFSCELEASGTEGLEWEGAWQEDFRFFTERGSLLALRVALSADFASAIERTRAAPKPAAAAPEELLQSAPPGVARESNLDLLMDIELEVTLRFGQREMSLGEILNLSAGSVIELEQQVQDPVELLVGGRVIAWGEVVTVEGNYGLRVTGLASREERLQSLRR